MRLEVRQVFPTAPHASGRVGSPLRAAPRRLRRGAGLPLRAHSNPLHVSGSEQPRGFPQDIRRLLASFAATVSERISPSPGATQGRLHYTQLYAALQVRPTPCHRPKRPRTRTWVSAEEGPDPHAIVDVPTFLNPQHQPPTGRQQPAPGTSQICPWRIFSPAFGAGNIN